MKKPTTNANIHVPESNFLLTGKNGGTQEVKATRIGVNESGALLMMKQNPETFRHEPYRIMAPGSWSDIALIEIRALK